MCAQVIANELNMEMYKINISQIVSKYIGETEKNLQAVFTEAKKVQLHPFLRRVRRYLRQA